MEIFGAMAKILANIDAVSKDRTSVGKFSFKYRGIDDCMNALHSSFGEAGVFLTQKVLTHEMTVVEGRGLPHIARVLITFWAKDGSSISSEVLGECIENGDKGIGKCMSYALKTCLLQTFLIPTEEDKDPDAVNQPITPVAKVHPSLQDSFEQSKTRLIARITNSDLAIKEDMIAAAQKATNPKALQDLEAYIVNYVKSGK